MVIIFSALIYFMIRVSVYWSEFDIAFLDRSSVVHAIIVFQLYANLLPEQALDLAVKQSSAGPDKTMNNSFDVFLF